MASHQVGYLLVAVLSGSCELTAFIGLAYLFFVFCSLLRHAVVGNTVELEEGTDYNFLTKV